MTGYEKREMVIEGLNAIHAVACGTGGDECYLNNIGIKQLQTLIDNATELLKAQEPTTIEERITLNKLHNIRIYAQVAELGWMDEAAAYTETVMGLLREEIHRMQKALTPRVLTLNKIPEHDGAVFIEYKSGDEDWALYIDEMQHSVVTTAGILLKKEYGIEWRAWTGRPTPEQRWQNV